MAPLLSLVYAVALLALAAFGSNANEAVPPGATVPAAALAKVFPGSKLFDLGLA